jgi:hypothetical protein
VATAVAEPRSPEAVRREIQSEREQLAAAVAELRDRVGETTDVNARLRGRAAVLAPAAFAAGFVVAGGVGASMRLLARRSRER